LEGKLFETHDVTLAARVFAPDVIWQNPSASVSLEKRNSSVS
jgi:hypothetical protein